MGKINLVFYDSDVTQISWKQTLQIGATPLLKSPALNAFVGSCNSYFPVYE